MENTISLSNEKVNIKPDWAFFVYFSVMFTLYTHTYIQLGIQIFIIAYVFLKKFLLNVYTIRKIDIKKLVFYFVWFGLLVLAFALSRKFWAPYILVGSKSLISYLRCFAIGLALFLYVDSREKALSVLESFLLAGAVLGATAILTTPINEYFQAGTTGFGTRIGQHRNQIGSLAAPMALASLYLKRYSNFKYGYWFIGFFVILTVLTGSRGSILQLIIIVGLFVSMDNNFFRILFKMTLFALGATLVILLIKNVPVLYDNIWSRFDDMITTMSGTEVADASTLGRGFYREIAWTLFKKRPWLGWGVDGFTCYLYNNPVYNGVYIRAVYAHCNFAELASDLGMLGLLIWYIPTFSMLIISLKYIRKSPFMEMCVYWLISMIILDYARIPWSSHLGIYLYFVVFLLIIYEYYHIKKQEQSITDCQESNQEGIEVKR